MKCPICKESVFPEWKVEGGRTACPNCAETRHQARVDLIRGFEIDVVTGKVSLYEV